MFRRGLIMAIAAGLALAACSSSSKEGSSTSTTTPKARPKVTITAHDFSFDVPAQIPAGYVDVTVDNQGKEDHQAQLVKLGTVSFAKFKATSDLAKVPAGTVFVGGPNEATPGKATTATVKLDPGKYAVVCFIPSPKDGKAHEAKGMVKQVEVVRTDATVDAAPPSDSTIELSEFTFVMPKDFDGKGMVDVTNVGGQIHELVLLALNPGKTLDDAKKFLLVPPGTPPPAGPPPFTAVPGIGGTVGLSTHQHNWLDMNLTPGHYMLICFFPNTAAPGGLPHALSGMVKEFTIS